MKGMEDSQDAPSSPAAQASTPGQCQNCGASEVAVSPIESGLRLTLSKAGRKEIPNQVCNNCLGDLKKIAAMDATLEGHKNEEYKQMEGLWNNRLQSVRAGRTSLQRGEYAEAAINYEKYLKILSLVTKVERQSLDPKSFNEHPQEITIIASVLWDLVLIYDSNPKFYGKQNESVELLAKFLRFSPIYNGIIRKAEKEFRRAKNPKAYANLLKLCDAQASRCFVANAAFETRVDPTVTLLCQFRDQVLRPSPLGRKFIALYYRRSPQAARYLHKKPYLKPVARCVLRGVARALKNIFPLQH